ncbi:hypothetical protein BDP27DRAFT_1423910 [Rhodocollybia butyracea]|uniref:Uncharacterized protein n=1 Tax=Rhodocollybia butyracea TaxID=206335 RepID=A0A9P5PIL5_9AGAR|nr:hypothetical protein BDP27DRAFT_1423910 [Rhodocollybia butyracea]
MNSRSANTLFSHFDFPSLNNLYMDMPYGGSHDWKANVFTSFISRSSCMITTFTLRDILMSDSELIEVLRVLPALLHLEIHHNERSQGPITSHLISSLIHQSTSISLIPKLHSLDLTSRSDTGDTFDDSVFVSMVQSRWFKPGSDLSAEMLALGRASIRSVVLKFFTRKLDAEVYKPLRILDAEGLRVVVIGMNGMQV